MATATIGPIGLLHRDRVRCAAIESGLIPHERRGLLDSVFMVRGPASAIARLRRDVEDMAEAQRRSDHAFFVRAMERSERRRHFWGRLIGRGRRLEGLTREESVRALDLMEAAREQHEDMSDDARGRLTASIRRVADAVRAGVSDDTLGTLVSVGFRYLQHDVRTGEAEIAKTLRRQVLGTRVTIDTWDDR